MPTTIPLRIKGEEKPNLEFHTDQVGFRKCLRMSYIFNFPYFSGSRPDVNVKITNYSDTSIKLSCVVRLYFLLPITSRQEREELQAGVAKMDNYGLREILPHKSIAIRYRFENIKNKVIMLLDLNAWAMQGSPLLQKQTSCILMLYPKMVVLLIF